MPKLEHSFSAEGTLAEVLEMLARIGVRPDYPVASPPDTSDVVHQFESGTGMRVTPIAPSPAVPGEQPDPDIREQQRKAASEARALSRKKREEQRAAAAAANKTSAPASKPSDTPTRDMSGDSETDDEGLTPDNEPRDPSDAMMDEMDQVARASPPTAPAPAPAARANGGAMPLTMDQRRERIVSALKQVQAITPGGSDAIREMVSQVAPGKRVKEIEDSLVPTLEDATATLCGRFNVPWPPAP